MKVQDGKIITLEYTITTDKGEMIESSVGKGGPLVFEFGKSGIIPGLSEHLRGMAAGEENEFTLAPEEAIGQPKSWPTKVIKKSEIPEGVSTKVGTLFEAGAIGNQIIQFAVLEDRPTEVLVRLIPPLAGKTLKVKAKVLDVKDA
ncbi:MAG: FKBP-type peptidyl-prolyl cis-trans isomerase [Deltaproteobacteria bacterium]|nr:FKBP-type peptidyl-prolyl cis-trans isomerase [Deltaproteobacteria bacterium]